MRHFLSKTIVVLIPVFFIASFISRTPITENKLPAPTYSYDALNIENQPITTSSFIDITLKSGITIPHIQHSEYLNGIHESLGSGACAFDYNNDGWIDLLTLNGSGTTHFFGKTKWWQSQNTSLTLYKNNGDKTFTDVTQDALLNYSSWTMGCSHGDFNNDGNIDIFITNYGENQRWQNNGDGTFSEIGKSAGIKGKDWSTNASIVDVNNDGLLDIYVTNFIQFKINSLTFEEHSGYQSVVPENFNATLYPGAKNHLYLNQGNFLFKEQAEQHGIQNQEGRSLSSRWIDINNDLLPDLIIANDTGTENKVYLNQKGASFVDISTKSHLGLIEKSSDIIHSDFNNDQQLDLFITTGKHQYPKIYTQQQPLNFEDVSLEYSLQNHISSSRSHWSILAKDFNLDGWKDIFLANGLLKANEETPLLPQGQPNTLLINNKAKNFINESQKLAPSTYPSFASRCALSVDFDNNGTHDLYITQNNGLGQLLENTTTNKDWIGFDVIGKQANRDGIGTKIKLISSQQTQHIGHQSFLCSSDKRIVFATNQNKGIEALVVWPDGTEQRINNLSKNKYYKITQGNQPEEIINSTTLHIPSSKIKFLAPERKLETIKWLIEEEKFSLASDELKLLLNHTHEKTQLETLKLAQTLPSHLKSAFIQEAISSNNKNLQLYAIGYAKITEDELLSKWLLQKISSADDDIACLAADSFAYFFDEEEALLLHKYLSITSLVQLAESNSNKKQICAVNALGKSEKYRALLPLIKLTNSDNPAVRKATIQALGHLKEKEAVDKLKNIFDSTKEDIKIRSLAAASIKKIDPSEKSSQYISKKLQDQRNTLLLKNLIANVGNNIILRKEILTASKSLTTSTIKDFSRSKVPTSTSDITIITSSKAKNFKERCSSTLPKKEKERKYQLLHFQDCLNQEKLLPNIPPLIKWGLESKNIVLQKTAAVLLSPRQEKWARQKTIEIITSKQYLMAVKISIIENLPERIPTDILKEFIKIFNEENNPLLSASLAKPLVATGDTLIVSKAFKHLQHSLTLNNKKIAFLYAEALINHAPEKTLDEVIF